MTFAVGVQRVVRAVTSSAAALAAAILVCLSPMVAAAERSSFPGFDGKFAFVSDTDGDDEIFVMSSDGTARVQLTNNAIGDIDPAWSRDGERIAFARKSSRGGDFEIFVMKGDGTGPVQLTKTAGDDREPTWSPDGARIAFTSSRDGDDEVFVMKADGSSLTQLTTNGASDRQPDWSPDGTRIAFTSNRGGGDDDDDEIFTTTTRGGATQITNNDANDTSPSWSPDGQKIAFASDRDGDDEVFAMSTRGFAPAQLTENATGDGEPVWAPSGRTIAFVSDRFGTPRLFVMEANGTAQSQLGGRLLASRSPAWQPKLVGLLKPQQSASNVTVESHGTYVVVTFDQKLKAAKPRVELRRKGKVWTQTAAGPAATHWEVKVDGLKLASQYELKIVMQKPTGGTRTYVHPTSVRTLERWVTFLYRWVKVHEDSDPLTCGEMEFDIKVGDQYRRLPPLTGDWDDEWVEMCDGDTWKPGAGSMNGVTLTGVTSDTVVVKAFAVDDDRWPTDLPLYCGTYACSGKWGEWAEAKKRLDVTPQKGKEAFKRDVRIYAINESGDPRFTWHITYTVSYH